MRLGIFGDSHFASLKRAYDENTVDLTGIDVEFWGHAGGTFRSLYFEDGAIRSKFEHVAQKYANVNKLGRMNFPVSAFDFMFFYGVRVGIDHLFSVYWHWRHQGQFVSLGLVDRVLRDHLEGLLGYRIAKAAAAENQAKIMLAAKPFPVLGVTRKPNALLPDFDDITAEDRNFVWDRLSKVLLEDNIHLIRQDERTIHAGLHTHPQYAIEDHIAKNDFAHMNGSYGAIALKNAVTLARSLTT